MRKTKAQISCAVTAQLISAFVLATRIVNPSSFQASSLFPRLYRSWSETLKTVFLHRGLYDLQGGVAVLLFFFYFVRE